MALVFDCVVFLLVIGLLLLIAIPHSGDDK
jgi:hypothetical protein